MVGIAVAALGIAGWIGLGAPLADWREDALAGRATALEDLREMHARAAALKADHAALSRTDALPLMWRADQMGEATAQIQATLSKAASDGGVSLRSISPNPARDMDLAQAAGFNLELEATLDQLAAFLSTIEHHAPALLVEQAMLRRLVPTAGQAPQPLLFARIEIAAPVMLTGEDRP
ncbi:hypothetical protein ATO11_11485 [Pseudaestuariivita atlantica]|uniref:General secretion pathway protein GspM n=1 Tax=Pseudaestuariivita atlantica TaxID=1317121 RepID=A0A0L1JPU5_9RHOB|nr:hypothetical protein ATO11_11485 [Pseudaestuariivita atlantica]